MTAIFRALKHWAFLPHPHSLLVELNPFQPKDQRRRALRFWLVLAFLLGLGQSLSHLWVIEYAGLWSGDLLLKLRPPPAASRTGIVLVTENERRTLLGAGTPINPSKLLRAVCAVLRVHPQRLGVDISTADVPLEKLPSQPVVWARGLLISRILDPQSDRSRIEVRQDEILGNKFPAALDGLAVVPVKPDWTARDIHFCYEYDTGRVMRTMVAALTRPDLSQPGQPCVREKFEQAGSYDVQYGFDRFTLSDFSPAELRDADLEHCIAGAGKWDPASAYARELTHPLKGRVLLLGGEYDPQDWHPTPYGLKPGVEVLAGFTEYVLHHGPGNQSGGWLKWPIKLLLALTIAWIHCRFRPLAALTLCLLGLGLLVLFGGLLAAYVAGYRAAMVPFFVGILLEQLVTSAEKAQEVAHVAHSTTHSIGSAPRPGANGPGS